MKDQDTTSTTGSQGLAPGESNARAVRGPDGSAPAGLRPGLTSTGGKAAAAAANASDAGKDTGAAAGSAGSSRSASAKKAKSKVAKRRR